MKNLKLNLGGIFGGVVCAAAAVAILYLLSNNDVPRRGYKLIGLAAFGGAAVGNWIWSLTLPSEPLDTQ
jgi:hypothetical protein